MKYLFITLFFCSFFIASGQSSPTVELYSQPEQQENLSLGKLPSENDLRNNAINEGWEDDNPDGTGIKENTGVVVAPIGNGIVTLIVLAVIYCVIIKWRKKIQ